jgi:serine protease Do
VLEVWRDRASRNVTIEIAELKEGRGGNPLKMEDHAPNRLGLAVRPLSAAERRAAGLDGGLLIEDVEGPALEAGLRPGDVLLGANGQRVATVEQLASIVEKSKRSIALLISRDGSTIFVPVKLGD